MHKRITQKVDKLLDVLTPSQRGGVTGYLIAVGVFFVAFVARLGIAPAEAGLPFLTFFPAVTLAAVLGGVGPGFLSMVVCAIVASYLFIPPFHSFSFTFNHECHLVKLRILH